MAKKGHAHSVLNGRLDPSEWDFTEVGDDEIDACLYYEYARVIDELRENIECWRDLASKEFGPKNRRRDILSSIKYKWVTSFLKAWKHIDNLLATIGEEFEERDKAIEDNHRVDSMIPDALKRYPPPLLNLLAAFSEFPNTPWQLIKSRKKKRIWAELLRIAAKSTSKDDPILLITDLTQNVLVSEGRGIAFSAIKADFERRFATSVRALAIPWHFRDPQLQVAFRQWLKANRPPEYPEPMISTSQQGIHLDRPYPKSY